MSSRAQSIPNCALGNGIKGGPYLHLDVRPETVNRYLAEAGETRRIDAHFIEIEAGRNG